MVVPFGKTANAVFGAAGGGGKTSMGARPGRMMPFGKTCTSLGGFIGGGAHSCFCSTRCLAALRCSSCSRQLDQRLPRLVIGCRAGETRAAQTWPLPKRLPGSLVRRGRRGPLGWLHPLGTNLGRARTTLNRGVGNGRLLVLGAPQEPRSRASCSWSRSFMLGLPLVSSTLVSLSLRGVEPRIP